MAKKQKKKINGFKLVLLLVVLGIFAYFYLTEGQNPFLTVQPPQTQSTEQSTPQSKTTDQEQNLPQKAQEATLVSTTKDLCIPISSKSKTGQAEEDRQIVNHLYYSLCYRESYEQAEWSAYCLDSENLVKNVNRTDDFRADPKVTTLSATPLDYKSSGYDRGHLSPAADFAFSKEAMSETFYMSNMSPQAGSLNRGIWKDLESTVRQWAQQYHRIFVVVGPVLDQESTYYKKIGKNQVAVPEFYYKVVLLALYEDEQDRATKDDAKNVTALAFVFPNQKCEGIIFDYACTVDEVEARTGIDFFPALPDEIEDLIEGRIEYEYWK